MLGASFHKEHHSRSSSEESFKRLVQYSPTIYESEEETDFAISEETYATPQEQQRNFEPSQNFDSGFCEEKVGFKFDDWNH